jgi:hypothetical protein
MNGQNEAKIALKTRTTGASGDVEDETKWLILRCAITKNAMRVRSAIAPQQKLAHGKAGRFLSLAKMAVAISLLSACRIPAKQMKRRIGE